MITGVVTARSGSQRLKDKNIRLLRGRPLFFWSIDALLHHELITKVLVTSDSNKYLTMVENEYGQRVETELRPPEYAKNTTKVVFELERLLSAGSIASEWFLLALPTSPLRTAEHVGELLNLWQSHRRHGYFSASVYSFPPQFAFKIDPISGAWENLFEDSPMVTNNTRSQDIPELYRPNGAMYLVHSETFRKTLNFYDKCLPFVMGDNIDIDTIDDFHLAELRLGRGR